jgi:F-type H+-transporting ATPase subunit alpha
MYCHAPCSACEQAVVSTQQRNSSTTIELSSYLEKRISGATNTKTSATEYNEVGKVISVGDGIARVYGLNNVQAGEMIVFACGLRGETMVHAL